VVFVEKHSKKKKILRKMYSWFFCWRIGNVDSGIVSALKDGTPTALRTLSDFDKKG
jgi:hypothetical protein